MGYKYILENNEKTVTIRKEFKEIVLWDVVKFLTDSLPSKRPIRILIEHDR